ncbi:hypothetical protein LTR53_019035, partial [Teratosphaeriaceae sp. CCFEE 6253]
MPPKKRARVESPQAQPDSPPTKRQTRSRNAKRSDADAGAADSAADMPAANVQKKQSGARKTKKSAEDEQADSKDSEVKVADSLSPAALRKPALTSQTKGEAADSVEDANEEVDLADAQVATDKHIRVPVD